MTGPSVPLSMLATRDVPYEWHDAVAIVAQLVGQVRAEVPSAQGRVPDLRGIAIESNGTLTLTMLPDPGHSMPGMPGAAQILQQLLSGKEQPAQLRLFGMQMATAEPPPTLDLFAEELAKWERPNRQAKLTSLYLRCLDQIGPAALSEEAKAREERIGAARAAAEAAAVPKPKPKPKPKAVVRTVWTPRSIGVMAAFGVVVAVGAAWIASGGPIPFLSADSTPSVQEMAPQESVSASSGRRVDIELPSEPLPPPPPEPIPPPPKPARAAARTSPMVTRAQQQLDRARSLFEQRAYSAATARTDDVLRILTPESSPQAEELRQTARSLAEVAHAAVIEEVAIAGREYHSGDPGVVEPIPLSNLPRPPAAGTPPERLQVLEIHVNVDGTVESATLVMNRPTFRNAWWTSAAKTWHFQPAMKDGRPVRFVMRLVLDDLGSP